jgi:hypothetical protein
MELWNRVLAFNPQHPAVLTALKRLEGRTRLKHAALVTAILAGIAGMIGGIARMRPAPRPLPPIAVAPAPQPVPGGAEKIGATPVAMSTPSPPVAAERRPEPHPRPTHVAATTKAPPNIADEAAAGGTRTFVLGPTPQNVDVYLDGQRQFAYDPDHKSLSVPWTGNHVIEFRSPSDCCFVERIEVGPDRPVPPDNVLARRLKWRPARLLITTDPPLPNARIMIKDLDHGGKATPAAAGEDVAVPFLATDEPSKEIEVGVDTGDSFTSDRVTVRAGQRLNHVVKVRTGN